MIKPELRLYGKVCKRCGRQFTVSWAKRRTAYCSDECRVLSSRALRHAAYRKAYCPAPPKEYVCIDCGKTFLHQGCGRPKYCDDCICKPVGYRPKYRMHRAKEI